MRHYQKLDKTTLDESTNTLLITNAEANSEGPNVWFGHEGMYVSISANYGPLEIALRPRQRDLITSLTQLKATDRLSVMRLVGTGQAHLGLGLSTRGELLLRATIVADATGQFAMNMVLTSGVREKLLQWLGVEASV
jgi:hypothetical protein